VAVATRSADAHVVARDRRDRGLRGRGMLLVRRHGDPRCRVHALSRNVPFRAGRLTLGVRNSDGDWRRQLLDRLDGRGCRLRRCDLADDGKWLSGHGRLGHRQRRRRYRRTRRQQAERIDVSVRIGGDAHAEVDVRLQSDLVAALADHADFCPLPQGAAALDARRPELEQRHGEAIIGRDRHCAAAPGHEADEGDRPADRCQHGAAELRADVDASVLASRVGVGTDGERPQHRSFGRPSPGERIRSRNQGRKDDGEHRRDNGRSTHLGPAFVGRGGHSRPR
jgi:hypothetical protein